MTLLSNEKYLKIIVCGEGGIGKTTLLNTFQKGHFSEASITLGLQPHVIRLNHGVKSLALQIWDLGGQKHFFDMGVYKKYCQGAHGAILCFDMSELDSLEKIPQWLDLLPTNIPKMLVGTKKDAGNDMRKLIDTKIKRLGLDTVFVCYLETSTKYDLPSVYNVFKELLQRVCSLNEEESAQLIQDYTEAHIPSLVAYPSELAV
ncbi:MAG: Rab family GTPase [Candidatus Hermodarchaeota archaeon]